MGDFGTRKEELGGSAWEGKSPARQSHAEVLSTSLRLWASSWMAVSGTSVAPRTLHGSFRLIPIHIIHLHVISKRTRKAKMIWGPKGGWAEARLEFSGSRSPAAHGAHSCLRSAWNACASVLASFISYVADIISGGLSPEGPDLLRLFLLKNVFIVCLHKILAPIMT